MFRLSLTINPKWVFISQKSEIEKRFDPFFYIPELLEFEKKFLSKKPNEIKDYAVSVSSGATPKTIESDLYYVEKEGGRPHTKQQQQRMLNN